MLVIINNKLIFCTCPLRVTSKITILKKLFEQIAPQYLERNGGYTRIVKLNRRLGDNAKTVLLELVGAVKTEEQVGKKAGEEAGTEKEEKAKSSREAKAKTKPKAKGKSKAKSSQKAKAKDKDKDKDKAADKESVAKDKTKAKSKSKTKSKSKKKED